NPSGPCAADRLQRAARMDKDAWLNGIYRALTDGRRRKGRRPCLAAIIGALEMDPPCARSFRRLGAARRDERALDQPDRLVLDGTEDAVGQTARAGPRAAVVG